MAPRRPFHDAVTNAAQGEVWLLLVEPTKHEHKTNTSFIAALSVTIVMDSFACRGRHMVRAITIDSRSRVGLISSGIVVLALLATVSSVSASEARSKPTPGQAVSLVSIAPESSPLDDQSTNPVTVVVRGVDNKTTVEINFETTPNGTKKQRGRCSVAKSRRAPDRCRVTLSHAYTTAGQYAISGKAGKERIFQVISVTDNRWIPPEGQVFNGWRTYDDTYGANFSPCQRITWFFDRSNEKPDRNTMIDDVRAGLAMLEPLTNLTFVETTDPREAALAFNWGDVSAYGDVAGSGETDGVNKGRVTFSDTDKTTENVWSGAGYQRLDDYPSPGYWWESDRRQSLVIHEVMHTLGFDHVDIPDSIMNPDFMNGTTFNVGDLDGLATMYKNNPC